jgi:hypothetical protein
VNVFDASERVLDWFLKNDYFNIDEHFKNVCLISDTDADKAALILALEELEKEKIILKKEFDKKEFWVLVSPLLNREQKIPSSLMTNLAIAQKVNSINNNSHCNPFSISENDLQTLLLAIK